jgi:hypothetical protein
MAAYQNRDTRIKFKLKYWVFALAAAAALIFVESTVARSGINISSRGEATALRFLGLIVVIGGFGAYYGWYNRRKFRVTVNHDGLTISRRPGKVFTLTDARLGLWGSGAMAMGTALHLQCGPHRFVLGGRDHRVSSRTRLDEPMAGYVDAWMWAAQFDELLGVVGPRSGLDVRPPALGEPTRCLLFPNPLLIQSMGSFQFGKRQRLLLSATQPQLAIDLTGDAIRVIDPSSNAQIASAWLSQVTATPAMYRPSYGHWYPSAENVINDYAYKRISTAPTLVVNVPGIQPLTIACRDSADAVGLKRRFSWRGDVPLHSEPAAYAVTGADWLTLVEKTGLAAYLDTAGDQR